MRSSAPTWLIIEPIFSGHHFIYLLEIVRGALARDIRVVLGIGDDAPGDAISTRIQAALPADAITLVRARLPRATAANRGTLGLAWSMLGWWRFLSRVYRNASRLERIDFVFLPYLDHTLFALSLLGSPFARTPFSGITMAQRFHLGEMGVNAARTKRGPIRRALFLKLLRTKELRRVHVIDDTLQAHVRRGHPELADKVSFIPDPTHPAAELPREQARKALGIPEHACLILVYGYIDARKGIARLLDWVAGAGVASSMHVLLAGFVAADVESIMNGPAARSLQDQRRLWTLGKYVEPNEEPAVFSAADIVWLAYENVESMSGVLVKAALYHKTVLFNAYGLIGRYAQRYGTTEAAGGPGVINNVPLPDGVLMRFFPRGGSGLEPLPDHSWDNACGAIFDAAQH